MNENNNDNDNDNPPTAEQITQGIELATETQRAKNALIGIAIVFGIGYLGGKAGGRAALKEIRSLAENAHFNAEVSYLNVQDTVKNGEIILDATKKVQEIVSGLQPA